MEQVKTVLRITKAQFEAILADLKRKHDHAYERVGFGYSKSVKLSNGTWVILLTDYQPVKDEYYVRDKTVGAHISDSAITESLQHAVNEQVGTFHTHLHEFADGIPTFSGTDMSSLPQLPISAVDFTENEVHGLFLLSENGVNASVCLPREDTLRVVDQIVVIGSPLMLNCPKKKLKVGRTDRYDRQSFLGTFSQDTLSRITIGVVGLGGGGSHIIQQLAHIGIQNYILYDPDYVSKSNLNRLVGATVEDAKVKRLKFDVACRMIKGLQHKANIMGGPTIWQENPDTIMEADIVVGCVDGLAVRRELEAECRRYLLPYLDIGMDIHTNGENPVMSGQIQLSMPGAICMNCSDYLSEDGLAEEANNYGAGGGLPQVVWPNAILAASAIGILIDLVTGWIGDQRTYRYIDYIGNQNLLEDNGAIDFIKEKSCVHYLVKKAGPIIL